MRAWFRWFLGLSGPERWGIVGTILTAIGLVVGIVSLIPAYTGSVSSLPAPAPSPPVAQAAPEKVASSDPKPAAARGDAPPQQITGNDNIQIGSIKDVRDVTINPKPKMRIRTVLLCWLSGNRNFVWTALMRGKGRHPVEKSRHRAAKV
jgi:hypothetical protein